MMSEQQQAARPSHSWNVEAAYPFRSLNRQALDALDTVDVIGASPPGYKKIKKKLRSREVTVVIPRASSQVATSSMMQMVGLRLMLGLRLLAQIVEMRCCNLFAHCLAVLNMGMKMELKLEKKTILQVSYSTQAKNMMVLRQEHKQAKVLANPSRAIRLLGEAQEMLANPSRAVRPFMGEVLVDRILQAV
jgi:hypothetical protein